MQLTEVLRLFDSPLSQEQCWSICYGTCRTLMRKRREDQQRRERIKYILNLDSLILTQRGEIEILQSEPNFQDLQKDSEIVFTIGNLVCRCLDHGLDEMAICEVRFQDDLAELIGGMVLQNSEFDEGIGDTDSLNESWESRKFFAHQHRMFSTVSDVARFCEARLLRRNIERTDHYKNVTKALYIEASELKAFLGHVLHDYVEKNPVSLDNIEGPELAKRYVKGWAMVWLKVMNELRMKTDKRRAEIEEKPEDYQTTPFDRVSLQETLKTREAIQRSDSLPENAEDRVFNFLKSRVSSQEEILTETKEDILNETKIDKTDGKDMTIINGVPEHKMKKIAVDSPLTRRINEWDNYSMDDTLEDDFLNGSYLSDDDNKDVSIEKQNSDEEKKKVVKQISQHLNLEFLPDISINTQEHFLRRATLENNKMENRLAKSEMNLQNIDIDDTADDLSKIGSSLTEVFKIRQEITRSEMEVTRNTNLKSLKICFGCRKTKFSLFTRSRICSVCSRKYCLKCMRENTVVSPDMANNVPVNLGVTYTGNPSALLNSSQHLCRSMFDLNKRNNREDKFSWVRNRMPKGVLISMCVACETFLSSIEREKTKQKWTVQLELDL